MNLSDYTSRERGDQAILARALGVPAQLLNQWSKGHRRVPAERCPAIERATGGAVTCEELRPDVDWQFIRKKPRPKPKPGENPNKPIAHSM